MHIREPELAALIFEREPLVIQSEQVQHRRVEVMHMHRIGGDIEAKLIGAPVTRAAFHAAAREPHGERVLVMIASRLRLLAVAADALRERRAAKFPGPDHQRVVEHPALLQVGNQRRHRPVCVLAFSRQRIREIRMTIPVGVVKLHHAHASRGLLRGR